MSLEQAIQENTLAAKALTAALQMAFTNVAARANTAMDEPSGAAAAKTETVKVETPKKSTTKAAESAAPASTPDTAGSTPAAAVASTAASETAPAGSSADQASPAFDYALLQRVVTELVAKDRNKAVEILAKYGAKKATELALDQREPCYADFKAALAGEDELA